jgi:hypothetical protein
LLKSIFYFMITYKIQGQWQLRGPWGHHLYIGFVGWSHCQLQTTLAEKQVRAGQSWVH